MQNLRAFTNTVSTWEEQDSTMPILFVGHGAPTFVLDENKYSIAWRKIGQSLPTPRAIVVISAHWLTPGKTLITASPKPRTIHDFGGFEDRLYQMQYPAPGEPELASEISNQLQSVPVELDHDWGFDHGAWCVLYHMFPNADIPVLQFSIDYKRDGQYHYDLAKQLAFLRQRGVLVLCSGNIVHNLRQITFPESTSYYWAREFDEQAKHLMDQGDFQSLVNYHQLGTAAQLSIPTPDHYFPLLYALGLKSDRDGISYPIEGLAHGSISMRSVLIS
jgi:4,5-DOPA dioxygenase extradiol